MARALRFQMVDARMRVQAAAMSHGFDDVRARLRDASQAVDHATHRLESLMARAVQRVRRRADAVGGRLSAARLSARVSAARVRFSLLCASRDAAMASRADEMKTRLGIAAASLDALSPLAVLERGYALAQSSDGRLLRDARAVEVGSVFSLRLAEGALRCRVEESETP